MFPAGCEIMQISLLNSLSVTRGTVMFICFLRGIKSIQSEVSTQDVILLKSWIANTVRNQPNHSIVI